MERKERFILRLLRLGHAQERNLLSDLDRDKSFILHKVSPQELNRALRNSSTLLSLFNHDRSIKNML